MLHGLFYVIVNENTHIFIYITGNRNKTNVKYTRALLLFYFLVDT